MVGLSVKVCVVSLSQMKTTTKDSRVRSVLVLGQFGIENRDDRHGNIDIFGAIEYYPNRQILPPMF